MIYDGCQIGDHFTAHSHVSIREFCSVGDRVTLHNGVVVGGDGFGFAKTAEGTQFKIVQTGRTVIEDDVEIQTLTSIDRATLGETRIKRGAKIDSLVQIGQPASWAKTTLSARKQASPAAPFLKRESPWRANRDPPAT